MAPLPISAPMMEFLSMYEVVVLAGGIIALYVKMNNELTKVKTRVFALEQSKDEVTDMLKQLSADILEIKLLLAREQIDK